jgi:uncharacterized peroxidase-related enzyme
MSAFTIHTLETAPDESKEMLEVVEKRMGFVPNLYLALAESPRTLDAYLTLSKLVSKSSFTPAEQNLILLAVSIENVCEYCAAAHSVGARFAKLPADVIDAVRERREIADERLQALREFAEVLVSKRGFVKKEMTAFLEAGFSQEQVLEVVMAVSMKTLSNYANHLIDTPLDEALESVRWSAESD